MQLFDYPLSINEINQPTELINGDALALFIKRLLLLEKGTFESNPDLGVGILKYRYMDISRADELKNEIVNQLCSALPMFSNVDVEILSTNNNTIRFRIILDDNILSFVSSTTKLTLEELK